MSETNHDEFAARTERRDWEDDDKGYIPRSLSGSDDYSTRSVGQAAIVEHSSGEGVEQISPASTESADNDWRMPSDEKERHIQALHSVREANKHLWPQSR